MPNKATATVKQGLELCYEGIGGQKKLQAWANENLTEFYKLWAKMLPTEVTGKDGGPVAIIVKYEEAVE